MLLGTIAVEIYDRDMYDALSYAPVALWDGLAEMGFLPALLGQVLQTPEEILDESGEPEEHVWFGRGVEGAVEGTFYVWDFESTFSGFKAMIAFQPDDESWTPREHGNWAETSLIPNLSRRWCGVKFSVYNDTVSVTVRLKDLKD